LRRGRLLAWIAVPSSSLPIEKLPAESRKISIGRFIIGFYVGRPLSQFFEARAQVDEENSAPHGFEPCFAEFGSSR
jgi:hypothetical protein